MAVVAAVLDTREGLLHLRRSLPCRLRACRSPASMRRLLQATLLDALVVGTRSLRSHDLLGLRSQFPALPVIVYSAFRPDDGDLLFRLEESGGATALAVEGVDDAVVGNLVWSRSLAESRRHLLGEAPRLLRLSEPIQLAAWAVLVSDGAAGLKAGDVARRLSVSREHLSRQFAAGGAPNLKRVLDLIRVVTAAQLLANPGYTPRDVARLLSFSTQSHLSATTRRVAGVPASRLCQTGPRFVFESFIRDLSRGRSRS
jgi:AraC-like DNA-binding protein